MPTIRLAHSPDADDAFMFYALAAGKIDTGDRAYVHDLADRYALLPHGASIGDGYGPRLVARTPPPADPRAALRDVVVATPGTRTTAHLALLLYQPAARTDSFVGMCVNDFTVDYGLRGRTAVQRLLDEGHKAGLLPARVQAAFVEG